MILVSSGFSFTGSTIPAGTGVLMQLYGDVSSDCLSQFIFSDPNGFGLVVGFLDDITDDGGDDGGDDGADDGGGELEPQYFTDLPDQTGESSLIIIEDVVGLDIGDEIGLFDANGVILTDSTGTNPEYGSVLVGSSVWEGDQLNIVAVLSIDLSDFKNRSIIPTFILLTMSYLIFKLK